jgi:MinD superfamily P-loop ATPase
MIIAVASGKGGTGKTTVAANLARAHGDVTLLDCDVEEPNIHLFVSGAPQGEPETVSILVPEVDESRCDGCADCSRFCAFKALAVLDKRVLVFPELCHGCGGCARVCPQGAIRETPKRVGVVETMRSGGRVTVVQGRLDVGVAMAPPLIRAVKAHIPKTEDAILDAPPGTSCPVVATLRETDFVVLVTEPTPFGLNDLKLAVAVVRELGLPFGVVVNRADRHDDRVAVYCRETGIPVLAEIPDDRRVAEAYSRGELMVDALPEYRTLFERLLADIVSQLKDASGVHPCSGDQARDRSFLCSGSGVR